MDETKNIQKDSLQETGQTSKDSEGITSAKETRTYSEAEVKKQVSDALAAAGRTAKQLTEKEASFQAREEAIKARETEIAEFQRQRDEVELEEARSDPEKMREYQYKQAKKMEITNLEAQKADIRRQQEEINRSKAEHEAEIKIARDTLTEIKLWQIGAKYGISHVALKELNLPDVEQAEKVAKALSAMAPKRPTTGEAEAATEKPFTPDSGVTSGTHGVFSPDQFEKLSISEKAKYLSKK